MKINFYSFHASEKCFRQQDLMYWCAVSTYITEILSQYKKVLLRERKRHTARRVARTRTAVPAGGCGLTHKVKI